MPIIHLPSHKHHELPKSTGPNPYVVHNPCQGEGKFELHEMQFDVPTETSVSFHLEKKGVIRNTGNVELTVKSPGD